MSRTADQVFDEYLVASARAGDRRSFELLVKRWNRKLVGHAWRLSGDREASLDAAQLGWVEIVRGLALLQDERAFPAWAYRIVSRVGAKQVGRAIGRRMLAEELADQPDPQPVETGSALDVHRLHVAIRALPPEQRSAIALYHLEEMSVAEVAVALDVPAGTVKTRLMHARRRLRAALEGEI